MMGEAKRDGVDTKAMMNSGIEREILDVMNADEGTPEDEAVWSDTLTALSETLDPIEPSPDVFKRLMASVDPASRFDVFASNVAQLMDVAVEKARSLLAAIDDAGSWEPGLIPGMHLYHLEGGPRTANAIVGFIRLDPGTVFPPHTHLGEESVLVLQGGYQDEDGSIIRAGEVAIGPPGSSHMFTAAEGEDLIYLVVVQEGVQIGDVVMRAGDPRI